MCNTFFPCIFNNENTNLQFCLCQFKYASCDRTMFLCLGYMDLMAYIQYFHCQTNKFYIN